MHAPLIIYISPVTYLLLSNTKSPCLSATANIKVIILRAVETLMISPDNYMYMYWYEAKI